jgi:hypothetical protein
MNIGKGWLIIEESFHKNTKSLVSIISPRRTWSYAQEYTEQTNIRLNPSFCVLPCMLPSLPKTAFLLCQVILITSSPDRV